MKNSFFKKIVLMLSIVLILTAIWIWFGIFFSLVKELYVYIDGFVWAFFAGIITFVAAFLIARIMFVITYWVIMLCFFLIGSLLVLLD